MIARISRILLHKGSKSAQGLLVVARYDVGEALHPQYHMPVLLPDATSTRVIVPSDVSLHYFLSLSDANNISVNSVFVQCPARLPGM